MKKILALALALSLVFSLAACGGNGGSSSAVSSTGSSAGTGGSAAADGQKRVITLGYAYANMDENNKRTMDAIEKRIAEVNAERDDIEVKFIYTDGQSSVDKQLADVESMIAQKPDLIQISAVDLVGSVPAAQAVANAGIICVDDRGMKDDSISYQFQGMDENTIKDMKKQWIVDYLEANPDVVLNFGLLYGLPAQVLQLIRNDDIKELAEEMPDRVKILDEKYANWSTQEAMAITEDWMQRYPEMNAISAASDDMILGAINALTSAGKVDDFLTLAVDGTKIGCQLVEEGKLDMTVKALQDKSYSQWVDIAIEAVEGTFNDDYYTPGTDALATVDSTNVSQYKDVN